MKLNLRYSKKISTKHTIMYVNASEYSWVTVIRYLLVDSLITKLFIHPYLTLKSKIIKKPICWDED